jgi:hypothetical protein
MLTALLFAALIPARSAVPVIVCSNIRDAETPVLRSSSGIEAVLKVHIEDDHGKNTHLCQADYTLALSSRSPDNFYGSDDDWDRKIAFRLEGFAQDQTRIFGIVSEVGKYRSLVIFAYHLPDGTSEVTDLTQAFRRNLGSRCLESLSVIGTTQSGTVVLSSEGSPACSFKGRWQLKIPSDAEVSRARELHHPIHPHVQPIQKSVVVVPLDMGTTIVSSSPQEPASH